MALGIFSIQMIELLCYLTVNFGGKTEESKLIKKKTGYVLTCCDFNIKI